MDLLDFNAADLYFDEPTSGAVEENLELAAVHYGEPIAELYLMRAYFLEPQHPSVHVALYRFFYYQHRFEEALKVADRVIALFAQRLGLNEEFMLVTAKEIDSIEPDQRVELRFYLMAMKGAGYIEMRLDQLPEAIQRLKKVAEFDEKDRLGVSVLVNLAEIEIERQSGIYRLKF